MLEVHQSGLSPIAPTPLIAGLLGPGSYDHAIGTIELIETHISWVILTGEIAYKIKKPVNLGFLDFSTLAKRRFYCEEEVRLNRRLAPDTYAMYRNPILPRCYARSGQPTPRSPPIFWVRSTPGRSSRPSGLSSRKKHTLERKIEKGETCIDCHKGIAHHLPEGYER